MPPTRKNRKDAPSRVQVPFKRAANDTGSVFDFNTIIKSMDEKLMVLGDGDYASLKVPWELLVGSTSPDNQLQIRPLHQGHKNSLVASFKLGVLSYSALLARVREVPATNEEKARIKQLYGKRFVTKNGVNYFDIFDGNHRYHTGLSLIEDKLPGWTLETRASVVIYLADTPDSLCISYANRINEIQHLARSASYLDLLTFVDVHCCKALMDYQSSSDYMSLTTARARQTKLREMRLRVVTDLRSNLSQTFQAASGCTGLDEKEIVAIEDKFSNANVTNMLRLTTWLGTAGMQMLNALQNIEWDQLAQDNAGRQLGDATWTVRAIKLKQKDAGWPAKRSAFMALNQHLERVHAEGAFEEANATRRAEVRLCCVNII